MAKRVSIFKCKSYFFWISGSFDMWLLLQVGIYIQSHSPDIFKTVEKLYFVDEQKFIGGFHCYSSHAKLFFNKLHFYNWPPSPSNGQPPSILHFSEPRSEFSDGCNWQLIDYSQLTRWFWPESVCQLVFFVLCFLVEPVLTASGDRV